MLFNRGIFKTFSKVLVNGIFNISALFENGSPADFYYLVDNEADQLIDNEGNLLITNFK